MGFCPSLIIIKSSDIQWPQALTNIESHKGFHLEQMHPKLYILNLYDGALEFKVTQGSKNSYIEIDKIDNKIPK